MSTLTKSPTTLSAAVKKALVKAFPNAKVSVTRGKGTASSWISSRVEIPRPADCIKQGESYCSSRDCTPCRSAYSVTYDKVQEVGFAAAAAVGGFYSYYSDDYSDSRPYDCHSISVDFIRPTAPAIPVVLA